MSEQPTCIDPEKTWGCISELCRWYPRCRLTSEPSEEVQS